MLGRDTEARPGARSRILGDHYAANGEPVKAEETYKLVLQKSNTIPGPTYLSKKIATLGNLAVVYPDQGRLFEAEKTYKGALALQRYTWPHPGTSRRPKLCSAKL